MAICFGMQSKAATQVIANLWLSHLAGALGNIIDSLFYGLLFSNSYDKSLAFSLKLGLCSLFFGHVVDMLHFMFTWVWPSWMPWIGGQSLLFLNQFSTLPIQPSALGLGLFCFNKRIFPKIKTLQCLQNGRNCEDECLSVHSL